MKKYGAVLFMTCCVAGATCVSVSAQTVFNAEVSQPKQSGDYHYQKRAEKKGMWKKGGERAFGHGLEGLGLTEEQQKKIDDHRNSAMEEAKMLMEQIRLKKEAIGAELQKETLDMDKITALQSEMKTLMAQKEDHRLKGILEMRSILTQEQFQKLQEKGKMYRRRFKDPSISNE